jgi:quercetin dioxygenase-like cupin family protein
MAYPGEELIHPITGDRVKYLEVGGETFRVDQIRMPGKFSIEGHIHALQTESFELLSGKARYMANGKESTLRPGEKVSFPPGTPHVNPWNDGDEEMHIIQSVSPALDFDVLHETLIVGAGRGYVRTDGSTKLLPMCVILHHTQSKTYSAKLPRGLQQVLFVLLAPVGRLLGYRYGVTPQE